MKRLLTIKGLGMVAAVVAILALAAAYVAAQGVFDKNVTASWTVLISGDAIQVYEEDGATVVNVIDFGTSFTDFFGNIPQPTHEVVVKNHSATAVQVVVTGDGADGIIPVFGPTTGDLKPQPSNLFVLQPQGQSGDLIRGFVGLSLPQLVSGSKTTTIIFRATATGDDATIIPFHEVVVPNAQTTADGNSSNLFPFNTPQFGGISAMRYQQVYSSGDIGGAGIIDKIAFRPDFNSGLAFSATGVSVDIRLSHVPFSPDGLSATLADNVGPDDTVVLDTNSLSYASNRTGCGPAGPCDFDIIIDLNDVFTFNGAGNLLLDIRLRTADASTDAGFFDAEFSIGDGVSRALNLTGNVTDTDGITGTTGLITKFFLRTFTPSPSSASFGGSPAPAVEAAGPVPGAAGAP